MVNLAANCDVSIPDFKIVYKGKDIPMSDAYQIGYAYNILSTSEFIKDNYNFSDDICVKMAIDVRNTMDKYDLTESAAIKEVISKYKKYKEDFV